MKETFKRRNILYSAIESTSPTTNYVTIQTHREQYLSGFFKLKEKKNMTGHWIDKWGPFKRICVHFTSKIPWTLLHGIFRSQMASYYYTRQPLESPHKTTIFENIVSFVASLYSFE